MKIERIPRFDVVVFDVDSTLSSVEGIDWLAARRGAEAEQHISELTARAMSGSVALETVYLSRLSYILPTRADLNELAAEYLQTIQPNAHKLCIDLRDAGCIVVLVSGGLRDAIRPLADYLGVPDSCLYAVELIFANDGTFVSLSGEQPLSTQLGKPAILQELKTRFPGSIAMIGDGATDAATCGVADCFIAYTGVARREAVVALADAEAHDFNSLYPLLFKPSSRDDSTATP